MSPPAELRQKLTPSFVDSLSPEGRDRLLDLLKERTALEARDEQSQLGWYDTDGVRQGGLIAFVRCTEPAMSAAGES